MGKIDVHADDFGESLHASRDILDCLTAGKLDSISVLSNMGCFEQCVALYREREKDFPKKPLISVHLNFMEGSCLERPWSVPSGCLPWWTGRDISLFPGENCSCLPGCPGERS